MPASRGAPAKILAVLAGVISLYLARMYRGGLVLLCLSIACGSDDGSQPPEAPAGVEASDGTAATHVSVTWMASRGASSYRVYRDGALVREVEATSLTDPDASGPSLASAPVATATQGTETDRVVVEWAPATTEPGSVHEYTVTAVNAAGESEPSTADAGHRGAAPIFTYELSIDGGPYIAIGQVTSFDDRAALPGEIVTGIPRASEGLYATHVALDIICVPPPGTIAACPLGHVSRGEPGPNRDYQVRALTGAGAGAESPPVTGFRGVGPLTYQWERSAQDADASYTTISSAMVASHDDTDAPATSEARFYRCRVSADGAASVVTSAARGWRQP